MSAREIYGADEWADISDMRFLQRLFPINLSQTTESSHFSVLFPPDGHHSTYPRQRLSPFKSLQINLLSDFVSAAKKDLERNR